MTLPVLIILAVLWAVVLVPPLLRSRSQRTADSIVDFNYTLDLLGRTNGNVEGPYDSDGAPDTPTVADTVVRRGVALPSAGRIRMTPLPVTTNVGPTTTAIQRSAKRRRDVLRVLAAAIAVTLVLATVAPMPALWALQIVVDVVMGAYLGLWAWARGIQTDRIDKVRYMPELRVPELALRRSASS
ncbi:MAG: hypothetical protein ACLPVY_21950 [Acidimicrobiia bacterium]